MRNPTRLVTLGLLAAILLAGAAAPDEPAGAAKPVPPPAAPGQGTAAIPLFLDTPADRDALWKRLLRPDFVVVDGDEFRDLREGKGPLPAGLPRPPVIASVAVSGEVDGDWARLKAEFGVVVEGDEPAWAPIRLDGLPVARASEDGVDLPTKVRDDRAWLVELRGRGEHRVDVEVLAPVRGPGDARRVDLPIPPAASTRIDLDVPREVLSASTGLDEPMAIDRPDDDGPICRLSARLSPRAKVELAWRERADPAVVLPTLLATQGEIAVDIDRGFLRIRSSWVVAAVRGMVDHLTFRIVPNEEVVDVEVEGATMVPVEKGTIIARKAVTIPLDQPLRPEHPQRLVITTRRPISSAGPARVLIQGYPFDLAKIQTGVVAIARSGPFFPVATEGRGLRRIDPRTDLPESVRNRPDTLLAFEFNAQPFDLTLQIEPTPPIVRVETSTTVAVAPGSARVDARLDCRATQGRPFELSVEVPKGLDLESAGPADVVESSRLVAADPAPAAAPDASPLDTPRVLTITLTRAAREADSFRVHLAGRCAIDAGRPVEVPLFRPLHAPASGGRVVVLGERDVAVDPPVGRDDRPSPFRVEWGPPPVGWDWPSGTAPGPGISTLWLRHDTSVASLPLRVTARPLSVRHENQATVTVDRKGAEVVDEVLGEVAFGAVSGLDVALPPEVPARWEVDGVDLAGRELLGREPDGTRRYRLRFAREYADRFRLRFRYRVPFAGPLAHDRDTKFQLAPARLLEGASSGQQVRLSSDPGISVDADGPGWSASAPVDASPSPESGPSVRRVATRAEDASGPLSVVARAEATVPMPTLVASRLWLRTLQRPDGDLETTAWYRVESRDGAMAVKLPAGSRWVRARIGGEEVAGSEVEVLGTDEYRVRFATKGSPGSALVGLEYVVPGPASIVTGPLAPPRLLGGAVVLQVAWEVQVTGTRVGVGVPDGWTDENEWYRDVLLLGRRPWKRPSELAAWVAGPDAPRVIPDDPASGSSPGRHGYLFSRAGSPTALPFPIVSRIWLVGLCSGPVLAIGLLILARRPPPRPVFGGLLLAAFLVGTFVHYTVVLLVIQSASLGLVLMAAALAMHWWLGRRERPRRAATSLARGSAGSSVGLSSAVGSDDSTAIRPRPGASGASSTVDHASLDDATVTSRSPVAPSTAGHAPQ